ncbi:MAG: sugar transferase, partial [Planctomycetes bacterium]|nr:sugar transferase [Planctomycetota bacterium]
MSSRHLKDRPSAWGSILSMFRKPHGVPGALSADELAQAFQQERSRTDRNGRGFCMVVFWKGEEGGDYDLRPLASHLRQWMRLYDLLGGLDDRHLAVLLPETDPVGARKFAEKSLRTFEDPTLGSEHGLTFDICSYPLETPEGHGPDGNAKARKPGQETEGSDAKDSELVAHSKDSAQAHDLAEAFLQPVSLTRRTVDILVSGTSLILLSPILAAAALAVKFTTPGPIIYSQLRAGPGGVPFRFYKFRSMYIDADSRKAALKDSNEKSGPIFKMKNDPRITPVGRYLRK